MLRGMHDPFISEPERMADAAPFSYLDGLNEPQRLAVETLNGPVLILAGAGTGKTRALITRLTHLLKTGTASPGQIMAVTFTNKAAAEMKERVGHMLGGVDVSQWWIGTFHSLAARMLRRHAELVGLRSNFTIIDDDDQIRLLKQVFEVLNIDAKTVAPRLVLGVIDKWKNDGVTPDKLIDRHTNAPISDLGFELPQALTAVQLVSVYQAYQARLLAVNACDFGDLLLHMVTIFRDPQNGVLAQYHARYSHLLVDEYQDTNTIQYQWLRLLAQARHNICCVGDDDQSIYSWRGANIQNILNFEKDFPEATIIRLEQNYRSTHPILHAANGLIAHNSGRLGKNLWTDKKIGDNVTIRVAIDQMDEARQIAEEIDSLGMKKISLDSMAILVRASSQMRAFEERLNSYGIRYRVVGGPRFYERLEIRDAMAYFRLIYQSSDDLAFERIINMPKRGLGAKTLDDIRRMSRQLGKPMLDTVAQLVEANELKPKQRATLQSFVHDILRWKTVSESVSPREFAAQVLEKSGYTAMWRADTSIEAAGRLDNLKELINAISNFDTLAAFLDHTALVMDHQEQRDQPKITLMTLHAAKGLEFDLVFLPGWEEGLFPNQRSMDETGLQGLEEERRLAYVGLTRARHNARIYYALRRQVFGEYSDSVPSRFIDELPKESVTDERQNMAQNWGQGGGQQGGRQAQWGSWSTQKWQKPVQSSGWNNAVPRAASSYIDAQESNAGFKVGQRVFSQKFGYGNITAAESDRLDIDFDKAGAKKVLDRFVTLADK